MMSHRNPLHPWVSLKLRRVQNIVCNLIFQEYQLLSGSLTYSSPQSFRWNFKTLALKKSDQINEQNFIALERYYFI